MVRARMDDTWENCIPPISCIIFQSAEHPSHHPMCQARSYHHPSFTVYTHTHSPTRAHTHSEALPFFLLLIDLSKASALAKFAFKSRNKVNKLGSLVFDAFLEHAAHPTTCSSLFSWGRAAVDTCNEYIYYVPVNICFSQQEGSVLQLNLNVVVTP